MDEVMAIKLIADTLNHLEKEERVRVLVWAQAKFGSTAMHAEGDNVGKQAVPDVSLSRAAIEVGVATKPKTKPSKKPKSIISMDKGLNLSPRGKVSAVEFAMIKAPSNAKEKCIVAVYYLREMVELERVTTQSVYTFFKTVQWPVPADLKNMLQQAGTQGWLDTADSEDIKLTANGENRVEHNLPTKKKV